MKRILIAALAVCFVSCEKKGLARRPYADFYFTQAQPANDSELQEFPERYLGKYEADSIYFLHIYKNCIVSENRVKFKVHKRDLDTLKNEITFEYGKIVSKASKDEFDVTEKGDSLELSSVEIDTVFLFSANQKAKRINGALVLSTKDSIYWKTEWLMLQKDALLVNQPFANDDIDRIDSLLKAKPEILAPQRYVLKPTRREFWKIMNLKHFGSEQKFKKVKQNT